VFFHGDADTLTYASLTEKVFQKAGSTDKTFRKLVGVYHEPHNDLEREEFLNEVCEWVNRRVGDKAFGKLSGLRCGIPAARKTSLPWKYLILLSIVLYLFIAWRIKVKLSPLKLMNLLKYFSKLFWPLALIIG
jgi:hypothetical protein